MAELTRRYIVMQMATEGPFDPSDPEAVFVLKPWKDPAALKALEAYRDHCYPELASEIMSWIAAIGAGPVVRGGVGARNEPYLAGRGAPPRPRAGRRTTAGAPRRATRRPSSRTAARPKRGTPTSGKRPRRSRPSR